MVTARTLILARRPDGAPQDADFAIRETAIAAPDGGVLVETLYVSVDPAMRAWISGERTYRDPVDPGDSMPALGIGRVIESRAPDVPVGAYVRGGFGVASHAVAPAAAVVRLPDDAATLPHHLGVLGIAGLSAWFGLTEVGRMRAGDTVIVSGAAGAVGSAAGQIARIAGAGTVIGVAGGAEKCAWARETFGFDAVLDHRGGDLAAAIRAVLPNGADVVFDNIGGVFLDGALDSLALGARVVICGGLSQYNAVARAGPANYLQLVIRRAAMAGFLVHDFAPQFRVATARLTRWHRAGQLIGAVDVIDGLESFPRALAGLFTGINRGKLLLAPNPEVL